MGELQKQARRFAGRLPFTFSYDAETRKALIMEGVRENWVPQPVQVISYQIPYLSAKGLSNGNLDNAFIVDDIQYFWKQCH